MKGSKKDPVIETIGKVKYHPNCGNRPLTAIGAVALTLSCGHKVEASVYPGKFLRGGYKSIQVGKSYYCYRCN